MGRKKRAILRIVNDEWEKRGEGRNGGGSKMLVGAPEAIFENVYESIGIFFNLRKKFNRYIVGYARV